MIMQSSSVLRRVAGICVMFVAALTLASGRAQQPPPPPQGGGVGAFAPPAINWPSPPLPDGPIMIESAEIRSLRIVVMTKQLQQPWSIAFLPDGAHSRYRASRPAANRAQWRPRSEPGRRRATGESRGPPGTDGRRAPSKIRREQVDLSLLSQASRRQRRSHDDRPRDVGRQSPDRCPRHLRVGRDRDRVVADRVRARRHAVHDDQRARHRPAGGSFAGSGRLRGQR